MELLKWEPGTVHVVLTVEDVALLSEGLEPEAFLEPGATDGRYTAACAMQAAFGAMFHALRLQDRVIDNIMADCAARAQTTQGGTE